MDLLLLFGLSCISKAVVCVAVEAGASAIAPFDAKFAMKVSG